MKLQYKEFPGKVVNWDDATLTITHFISTEAQDSGGDIMMAKGMVVRGKPVVLFQHGQDPVFGNEPIAKPVKFEAGEFEGKTGILATTKYFDDRKLTIPTCVGQRLYEKAKDDTMPNWSVGFNSTKEHPCKGGRVVDEWELHEYSQVAVGMNKEATTLALKGLSPVPDIDLTKIRFVVKSESDDDAATCTKLAHAATIGAKDDSMDDHLKAAKLHEEAAKAHKNEAIKGHHKEAAAAHKRIAKDLDAGEIVNKDDMEAAKTHSAAAHEMATEKDLPVNSEEMTYEKGAEVECLDGACKMLDGKPYPSEHACRIADPSMFDKFRRSNGAQEHDGKKIDVIYGHEKESGKWGIQALRYPKESWTSEQASAHCKTRDGSFSAATTNKAKPRKADHELAHKGIRAFHKEMMDDLKEAAMDKDLLDKGVDGCAKEALEDFADNAGPHVEKYIKAVRDMGKDDVLPSMEGTEEPERKDYSAPHRELHKMRDEMIKAIHAYKGDKSAVPEHAAKAILKKHHEDALPHAKNFIKSWREGHSAEHKPEADPAAPAEKVLKITQPQAPVEKTLRLSVEAEKPEPAITKELVQKLVADGLKNWGESFRAELRRLSGKVTN